MHLSIFILEAGGSSSCFFSCLRDGRQPRQIVQTSVRLSVGLAPGLTNLLALEAHRKLGGAERIELAIMLGLGDAHGQVAIEWTVENMGARFKVMENRQQVKARSFTDGKTFDFGGGIGRRRAYLFPFSDQQTLPRTLEVPSVFTRFCLDSAIVTGLLAVAGKTGMVLLLQVGWIRRLIVRSLKLLRFGGDRFAVKAEAWGRSQEGRTESAECLIRGRNQSDATAKVAAAAAVMVMNSAMPGGVYHLEQFTDLSAMLKVLRTDIALDVRLSPMREERVEVR